MRSIWFFLGVISFSIHSAQCEPLTVGSWLKATNTVDRAKQFWQELLVREIRDNAALLFAPDETQCAYYISNADESMVKLRSIGGEPRRELSLFTGKGTATKALLPMNLVWSPDSDRILVQFGFADSDASGWFPYDAQTGRFLGDKEKLGGLEKLGPRNVVERRGYTGRTSYPVWTLGGKEFSSEDDARKAGFSKFFSPAAYERQPDLGGLVLFGEQWTLYYVLQGAVNSIWTARVIREGELLDTVILAGPTYQKVFFVYSGEQLLLKVCWHAYRKGTNTLVHSNSTFHAITVDLGNQRLENIKDLGSKGLLIQTSDAKRRSWRLLDIRKLCVDNSFGGLSGAFVER